MKNFLRIKPEDWEKEREIGQISFIIKRTIIFAIFLIPLNLLSNYLLSDTKEVRPGINIFTGVTMSVAVSINEWIGLEYQYRKSVRKNRLDKSENYGEKEKQISKRQTY
ncbi:MAG: hypothetical protein LH614_16925 [Pyrinomonadaceae bacterium]|nr:hypothetical protein [Pyrinomonadaceae bacterium]